MAAPPVAKGTSIVIWRCWWSSRTASPRGRPEPDTPQAWVERAESSLALAKVILDWARVTI